jgi:putative phosphoribosyl transferase
MPFLDRTQAGQLLALRLRHLRGKDVVVLGLPRGGVPVASEVARALAAPLDVLVVRKLGVPSQPELAMGAVGEDGVRVLNNEVMGLLTITPEQLAAVERRERVEVERRARTYRGDRPRQALQGRTVVIVDDGIATGSTARAACQVARAQGAQQVVLAVPVAPRESAALLRLDVDEMVCLETPEMFFAVGEWYADFAQTTDEQVVELLAAAVQPPRPPVRRHPYDDEVRVAVHDAAVAGHLTIPAAASGVVLFAHGSGSSRHSPRNQRVAAALNDAGIATLLFDLLTPDEEQRRSNVFDIDLLASRLVAATHWLRHQPDAQGLRIGYFGASTGAAAALVAAAHFGSEISAVVSRGGRPDLAGAALVEVVAPTLLIVGGRDEVVIEVNRQAQARLRCYSRLEIVAGATHLFEEPGALDSVAELACDWFATQFGSQRQLAAEPV